MNDLFFGVKLSVVGLWQDRNKNITWDFRSKWRFREPSTISSILNPLQP